MSKDSKWNTEKIRGRKTMNDATANSLVQELRKITEMLRAIAIHLEKISKKT